MNFEDDAKVEPTNKQLKELGSLVEFQIGLENDVADLTEKLKEKKARLDKVRRGALPELMQTLGYSMLKTNFGSTVEIKRGIDASITQANQNKAFDWLRKNGNEAIIKTEIKQTYTGMENDKRDFAYTQMDLVGIAYQIKEGIHTQTLKAFVKTELEEGREINSAITVYEYGIAKIIQ